MTDNIANETTLKIGEKMQDGTVYAGISPDTGRTMYATPADAPGTYTFNEAARYARNLYAHSSRDFRVPTKGELNVLYNNSAAIGGFNTSGLGRSGWYWSSSQFENEYAWEQRFSDGGPSPSYKIGDFSLRCVRG